MTFARTSPPRTPSRRFAAAGALLAGLASCSPPPPPAVTPTIAVAEAQPAPAPIATEEEAVAEPEDLLVIVRMGSPVRELSVWRDLLPAHTAFGQLASLGAEGVARVVLGSLGEHVDVTAPFDVAFLQKSEDGGSPTVGSVVLRDAAEAQRKAAADFEFVPLPDGSIAVKPRRGAKDVGLVAKSKLACSILRGGAPRADHLVCTTGREQLEQVAPYLVRTVALTPAREGLHAEIPVATFQRKVAALAKADEKEDGGSAESVAPGLAASERLGKELAGQFSEDFANLALDAHASTSGVVLGLDLRFRSLRSPMSVVMLGTRGQGVPATFWKIPADADLALYLPGASHDAMRAAFEPLWAALRETPPPEGGSDGKWLEFVARLQSLFLTGGPILAAHGPPPPAAAPAKAPARAVDPKKQHLAARQAASGWLLFGAPEPVETWSSGLRELHAIDASSPAKKGKAGGAGAGTAAPKRKPSRTHVRTEEIKIGASEKLPAGSLHLAFRTTPDPKYAPGDGRRPPLEVAYVHHVYVAGSAEHTWVAVSENEALARAKVREVLASDAAGLAGRPELAPIRGLPPGGVGFLTLRGLLALDDDAETPAELAEAQAEQQAVASLPSAGLAPMFVSSSPTREGDGASLQIGGALSIAAVLDLIRWIQ